MNDDTTAAGDRRIYTVRQLNRTVREVLERDFGPLWIEGEISNLARPASGHWYFSLKDDRAQVRCALFRNRRPAGGWVPANGEQVLLWARVSLYEPRGDYQLIAESIEPLGDGRLRQALERLMHKLQGEGLFDPALKRPLPALARRIGVITSPSGAALHDVLQVLRRRAPFIPVIVYPSPVQGEEAASRLKAALQTAVRRRECDVLLMVRGGGSLEDLWPFNDEQLARAIRDCPLPLVTGIGHEIDLTVADLAADLRAPTPSAAAELVSPDVAELRQRLAASRAALQRRLLRRLGDRARDLAASRRRLQGQHPLRRLRQLQQTADELLLRLPRSLRNRLRHEQGRLQRSRERLRAHSPERRIDSLRLHLVRLRERLRDAAGVIFQDLA